MRTSLRTGSPRWAAGFFFVLCSCSGMAMNTGLPGDTLRGSYPLNDPRNPNCPCHRYQQQAEEEYQQLQQAGKAPRDTSINLLALNTPLEQTTKEERLVNENSLKKELPHKKTKIASRHRSRKKLSATKTKRRSSQGRRGNGRVVACFHW